MARWFPVVNPFDCHANDGGFAVVFALGEPGAIRRAPQTSYQLWIARELCGTRCHDKAIGADDRQPDPWPDRELRHLTRALVRQEIDNRRRRPSLSAVAPFHPWKTHGHTSPSVDGGSRL